MIEFKDVKKTYGKNTKALRGVSFTVNDGEFAFITGTSGSGKTTIIRLLLREQIATSGQVLVGGKDISKIAMKDLPYYRRRMGVVFQDFRLLKDSTVYENVAFAKRIIGASKSEIAREVPRVLEQVGLASRYRAYPSELSGGEQQRVAIARAMINRPEFIIADEPTGNLDPANAWNIMNLLNDINKDGTTVLVVSHSQDIVEGMQKRVINIRGGLVHSDGLWTPEEVKA